jgi:mono/diheme cytochrome c family protein
LTDGETVVNDGTPLPRSRPKRDYPIARGVAPPPGWRGRAAEALPVYTHRAGAENAPENPQAPIVRPPDLPANRQVGHVVLLGIGVLVLAVSVRVGFELSRLAKPQTAVGEAPPEPPPAVVPSAAPQSAKPAEPEPAPAKPAEPAAVVVVPPAAKPEPRLPEPGRPAASFIKDVQPIVTAKCVTCHGKDNKKKGGLDLRTLDALNKGGENGQVVVGGQLEKSLLWESVDNGTMPPGKPKLTSAEKDTLKRWIEGGAK